MNSKSLILIAAILSLLSCKYRDPKNDNKVSDCQIKELKLEEYLDSISAELPSDTLTFSMQDFFSFDSVFIFQPYTSIVKLEDELKCRFQNFVYQDDDTWCLVLLRKNAKYYFSVVKRKYDLINLEGRYSSDIPLIIGTKQDSRFLFRFSK